MAGGVLEQPSRPAPVNGRRRAEKQARERGQTALLAWLGVGALACVVAWGFLVKAAIDFGQAALNGRTVAWAFTGVATVGAIGCLLLMYVVVVRLVKTARTPRLPRSARPTGGRRAAR